MAAISLTASTTNKSTQAAKLPGISTAYQLLDPQQSGGRVRCLWWNYSNTDEAKAANEFIIFGLLPARARVLGGQVYCDGAVTNADLDVGFVPLSTLDDTLIDCFGDGIDIATAGTYPLCEGAQGDYMGYVTQEAGYVVGKLLTAGLAQNDNLNGYLLYVENS